MLRECLLAVARLDPPPLEVIVAIDGQSPGIREVSGILGFHPVEVAGAPGVSATRNAGTASACGRWLASREVVEISNAALTETMALLRLWRGGVARLRRRFSLPVEFVVLLEIRGSNFHRSPTHAGRAFPFPSESGCFFSKL